MVGADDPAPVYIGRLGLTDDSGRRLLVDWRSPAAEPFFGATHADPMGLVSRRRYRWTRGRVTDYWDEVFAAAGLRGRAALDDQSAFIASLGADRSSRMRDVLGTIAADQDAIIRAGSRGALVVDGGPGTGKTVVALHRTAYLLYSDPRLGHRRGGVLFVGPHEPYLAYVSDVLPSLGEEGVQTCTLRDLVAEGATAPDEHDPEVARLKAGLELVRAIEPAVALYEEPPTEPLAVTTPWDEVWVSPDDWAAAFAAPPPGTPHHEARDLVWEELLSIIVGRHDDGMPHRRRSAGRWSATATCARPSTAPGRRSRPPTSSATSGRSLPTCAGAPRPRPRGGRPAAAARPDAPGRCRTSRSSTPRGSVSATRRRPAQASARGGAGGRTRATWPASSTTSSRPTTPRCTSCRCCAPRT